MVGGRRLEHIGFLAGDPLIHRVSGLVRLPSARTVSRRLKSFTADSLGRLRDLNAELVARVVDRLPVRTLTIDVDGTVVSTGLQVGGARRGYNPHHRKVPSYYPITAHLAETGHILRVENRRGNVGDGSHSIDFLNHVFHQLDESLEGRHRLSFRMDGDFFKHPVLELIHEKGARFAVKVPFWRCLDLQGEIRRQRDWRRVEDGVEYFETTVAVKKWQWPIRAVVYRKKVRHKSAKNYQLDLFDPADGHYEYSAVATTLTYQGPELWRFMCGRGAHESAIGRLKSGLAFDTVPTSDEKANSAWQQLVTITHNLLINFQFDTGAALRSRRQDRAAETIGRQHRHSFVGSGRSRHTSADARPGVPERGRIRRRAGETSTVAEEAVRPAMHFPGR